MKLVQPRKPKKLHDELMVELTKFNHRKAADSKWKPIAIEHRQKGKLVGGLYGGTLWGWLYIELLWVDEDFRGKSLGRRLVGMAEMIGKKRGCQGAYLSTFDFQAPGFYRKLGYRGFGRLKDFPKGWSRRWMSKRLS